jgi:asparagine synthetase B (glutamine-hydrolysing)
VKTCRTCEVNQELAFFRESRADCRKCEAEKCREYKATHVEQLRAKRLASYQANPEKAREKVREYRKANPGYSKNYARTYAKKNPEKLKKYQQKMLREHPEKNRAARSLRRAREKQAVPRWVDRAAILAMFEEAARLTIETGVIWHVDHIVPLASDVVCGLHWHGNLQVIPAVFNQSKSNKFDPNTPLAVGAF